MYAITAQSRRQSCRKIISTYCSEERACEVLAALCPEEMMENFSVGDKRLALRNAIYRVEALKDADIARGWTISKIEKALK